jgi:hypothetical protein
MPPTRPLPTPQPSLPERIAALRQELDAAIDELAAKEKLNCPTLPLVSIRQTLIARGGQCTCRQYLIATGVLK